MKFTKMHGAGNDYVFVDGRAGERDWPALSVAMSDRHLGVGSDGVIVLQRAAEADIRMSMFNADGSQGEMCGNGIRCFVRFAIDNGAVSADRSPITVETLAGVLEVAPGWDGGELTHASVSMGEPILEPAKVPVHVSGAGPVLDYPLTVGGRSFDLTFVSMGNPHAVAFVDEPVEGVPLHEIGPLVENHPIFPNRVNFEIVNVRGATALCSARLGARVGPHAGLRHRRLRHRGRGAAARPHWRRSGRGAPGRRTDRSMARRRRSYAQRPRRQGVRGHLARLGPHTKSDTGGCQ